MDESRRFTDQEIALVLKRAAEVEEAQPSSAPRGLSLRELREIAAEVGISDDALARAVRSLDHQRAGGSTLWKAPAVRRAVRAVEGRLDERGVSRLVREIDERTDNTGSVTEALGSVRWTSTDRIRSMQVSITPQDRETVIQVMEKTVPRVRRIIHFLPAAWAAMLATPPIISMNPSGLSALLAYGLTALAGAGIGRLAWTWMSANSARRVRRLAADLAEATRHPPPAP